MTVDNPGVFEDVAPALGLRIRPPSVEYDWQLVRLLVVVAQVRAPALRLVFSGGSALRQAHQVVPRMSIDADLRVISDAPIRRSQLRALRRQIGEAIRDADFEFDPDNPDQCYSRNSSRFAAFRVPYEPVTAGNLPATVQLEVSAYPLHEAPVRRPVSSLVTRAQGGPPDIPSMLCVSLEETAADKTVGFSRRVSDLVARNREPRPDLMRHLYDLHLLAAHVDEHRVARLAQLIASQEREAYRGKSPRFAADPSAEAAKAIAAMQTDSRWRVAFQGFQADAVYGDTIEYDRAVDTFQRFVTSWTR